MHARFLTTGPLPLSALVFTLAFTSISTPSAQSAAAAARSGFTIVGRAIAQDQGSWQLDYRLRYEGADPLTIAPADIAAKLEGWVSNSRVPSHAVPRFSSLVISGTAGLSTVGDIVASADDATRCRERATIQIWGAGAAEPPPVSGQATEPAGIDRSPSLNVAPGDVFFVRLRLDHLHILHSDYDPLLSNRELELRLGSLIVRDVVPMDREQYLAMPRGTWPIPPEERRDTRHYVSGPDSLHLEAHIPGNQYYRFPERPVRYATKMRLRFWYLIASGTEGECRARIAQYKDTPTAWKVLSEGAQEECLAVVGRWVKVERVFRTEPEATTLALDFRITSPNDVGEMWIDDVSLEPVVGAPAGP